MSIRKLACVFVVAMLIAGLPSASQADLVANADTEGVGVGQVTVEGSTTLIGGVLTFPAPADIARLNDFPGLPSDAPWSVSFWVNNTQSFDRDMIAFDADKADIRTDEGEPDGLTRFRMDCDGDDLTPADTYTDITDNNWHHLGISYNPYSVLPETAFYVDGVHQGTEGSSSWSLNDGGSLYLGGWPGSGKNEMAGQMKGVGFYNIALPPGDFVGLAEGDRPDGTGDPPDSPQVPSGLIASVDRTNGQSGDRDPIGEFDGETDPEPLRLWGFVPGNYYFSDREYTIDTVPDILNNAEFVRTFNTDKGGDEDDVNYAVTLEAPADLYLLMDDRFGDDQQARVDAVVSDFATAGTFTDTGLDVLIDEDHGPTQSVFGASVRWPVGTYNFGSGTSGNNFYGIVAVPEPSTLVLAAMGLLGLICWRRRR